MKIKFNLIRYLKYMERTILINIYSERCSKTANACFTLWRVRVSQILISKIATKA